MNQETTSQRYASPLDASNGLEDARPSLSAILEDAASSRLFLMTTLGAVTGQIPALAAGGVLQDPRVVVTVGLTVIAGVGAFLAAIEETHLDHERGRWVFTATMALSVTVNVSAAGAGALLAHWASFDHLRYFAAAALIVIAYEIARDQTITLPRGVPAPAFVIVLGLLVEAIV